MGKTIKTLIIATLFFSVCFAENNSGNNIQENIISMEENIKILSGIVSKINNNQTNYQVDKEAIKEIYTINNDSMHTTFNWIMTAISTVGLLFSAIFGILAFFGLKDVGKLKENFNIDLTNLKTKSNKITEQYNEMEKIKNEYEQKFLLILEKNNKQDNKIKSLELKEKFYFYKQNRNWLQALDYITTYLSLDGNDDDNEAKKEKGYIYFKMTKYDEAIKQYEEVLKGGLNDRSTILNLLELYVISGSNIKYENLIEEKYDILETDESKNTLGYFGVLKEYIKGESVEKIKNSINDFIKTSEPEEKRKWIDRDFSDLNRFLNTKESSNGKILIEEFIGFLSGKINKTELLDKIGKIN